MIVAHDNLEGETRASLEKLKEFLGLNPTFNPIEAVVNSSARFKFELSGTVEINEYLDGETPFVDGSDPNAWKLTSQEAVLLLSGLNCGGAARGTAGTFEAFEILGRPLTLEQQQFVRSRGMIYFDLRHGIVEVGTSNSPGFRIVGDS